MVRLCEAHELPDQGAAGALPMRVFCVIGYEHNQTVSPFATTTAHPTWNYEMHLYGRHARARLSLRLLTAHGAQRCHQHGRHA